MTRRVELPDSDYLSVRDAARALNVHENTIRNWSQAGVIHVIRLPNSKRYIRVPVSEVRRLLDQGNVWPPQPPSGT